MSKNEQKPKWKKLKAFFLRTDDRTAIENRKSSGPSGGRGRRDSLDSEENVHNVAVREAAHSSPSSPPPPRPRPVTQFEEATKFATIATPLRPVVIVEKKPAEISNVVAFREEYQAKTKESANEKKEPEPKKETPKETSKEPPKEPPKEQPKEHPKESQSGSAKDTAKEPEEPKKSKVIYRVEYVQYADRKVQRFIPILTDDETSK